MASTLAVLTETLSVRPRLSLDTSARVPRVMVVVNGATVAAAVAAAAALIDKLDVYSIRGLPDALDTKASTADLERVRQLTVVNALIFG